MSTDDQAPVEIGPLLDRKTNGPRTPRGIRFSDSEWKRVQTAAAERGIPAAEFIRDAALAAAGGNTGTDPAVLTPGHIALIERTYRCAHILATLKRDDMVRAGRGDVVDRLVIEVRKAQAAVLETSGA